MSHAPGRWKPYPAYNPCGIEWLGELPAGWALQRLKRCSKRPIANGIGEASEYDEPTWPRYIRITDIAGVRSLRDHTFRSLPPSIASAAMVYPGDILLAAVGATFGKSYWHQHDLGPACYAGYLVRFAPSAAIIAASYAAYWTETTVYWAQVQSRVIQSTIQNFSAAKYRDLILTLPPLAEQHAIADFLDRETARLDALVARKRQLIEKLKEKRTALISHAVTRGLDPNAKLKPSGIEWIGDVPEGWEVWKVRHGFGGLGSGATPSTDDYGYYGGDILWVTTSELRERVIYDTDKKVTALALKAIPALKVYPPGTLLIAMYGATIGRLGILGVPACTNQACCALALPTQLDQEFVRYWLLGMRSVVISFASGGGQPNLSQEVLRSLRVPAPGCAEQRAIADFLDRETGQIDALVAKVESAIEKLQEYRTALITAAVTGKIDVRGEAA